MILEGFEIENWSCIKRVSVSDLPPTGAVVFHGPNGTGKSSIIAAIRACLMDFPSGSNSKELRRWFPKNGGDKPRVSVTFAARGSSWRVTKQFGTKESKLESRTACGTWRLERSTASDTHEELKRLLGDKGSRLGLHQLLWLTQAEFQLPDPRNFDPDVQSQLRAVLGVLQTPLDDRFHARVKDGWARWFGARSKPGEKPKLKRDCPLDKAMATLERRRSDLAEIEERYQVHERMVEKSGSLEILLRDLRRQRASKASEVESLQTEYENSLKRLELHRLASERVAETENRLNDQQIQLKGRLESEMRLREAEASAKGTGLAVEEASRLLEMCEEGLRERRRMQQAVDDTGRKLQARLNEVGDRQKLLTLREQLKVARDNLSRAEQAAVELERMTRESHERTAPDSVTIEALELNRAQAARAQANLEAAAITLTLFPEAGARGTLLAIDGVPAGGQHEGSPIQHSIRRRAEIVVMGWGRAEITRGADAQGLDQIEAELSELDRSFAEGLAPFGISPGDATALDQLRRLVADKEAREPEMRRRREEINRLAPQGLDPLREKLTRLEKTLQAHESKHAVHSHLADLPEEPAELERLANQVGEEIARNNGIASSLRQKIAELELELEGDPETDRSRAERSPRPDDSKCSPIGLRQQEATAKQVHATAVATAEVLSSELRRVRSVEELKHSIHVAEEAFTRASAELLAARLNDGEETIRERLDAAKEGFRAIEVRLEEAEKEMHQIEAVLRLTEGLHQHRAAAATLAEELARQVERELLEADAFDRLYALFEECREKQLGAVMAPIQDRVLRWMRVLRIGGYQSVRFNDQFLPERLIASDGAVELMLAEESTGTLEQIALMVRLALGSLLSTPDDPVVAMLDDPLTHSDVVRLDRMRAVLKNAAAGDLISVPPSGPLQIMVFTCHPEWFAIDGARTVDLSKPEILLKHS